LNNKPGEIKTLRKIFVILIVLFNYSIVNPGPALAQQGFVDFQVFYDDLSPFGQWVDFSNYGYVWIPDLGPDFTPYLSNCYMAAFYGLLAAIPLSYCHVILLSSEDAIKCLSV